jgi:hypothetical protein
VLNSFFKTKITRPFNRGRIVFSTNGPQTTKCPHAKELSNSLITQLKNEQIT